MAKNKLSTKKKHKLNAVYAEGKREVLSPFVGKSFVALVTVTNKTNYGGMKRLLEEVFIPELNVWIPHVWVKEEVLPLGREPHGSRKLEVTVTSYRDTRNGGKKYGLKLRPGKLLRKYAKPKITKPKWMKEED